MLGSLTTILQPFACHAAFTLGLGHPLAIIENRGAKLERSPKAFETLCRTARFMEM